MVMVAKLSVNVAVVQENHILLIKREDFEVWGMPGGDIEHGETPMQAAIRETKEETGVDVRITRFVGLYVLPEWFNSVAVFAGEPIGGDLQTQAGESLDVRYWHINQLPETMLWFQRHRIAHAFDGLSGGLIQQDVPWDLPKKLTRKQLYARRDKSGLSRSEYAFETFGRTGTTEILLDPLAEDDAQAESKTPAVLSAAELAAAHAARTPDQYGDHLLNQLRETGRIYWQP